ncbi:EamA family transporter [Oribacterium sp. C9]|uniref:EamA family transporter n=1 Tax=Oribacterium sp. C9 TaxID=1943579 RepID=UPI00098EC8B8|nr:EamA family transporter [Oribacterium sp. C9]
MDEKGAVKMKMVYMFPLLMVILCNTGYHLIMKSLPNNTNPFLGLAATYGAAFIGSILIFLLTRHTIFAQDNGNVCPMNYLLGLVLIGVEGGYILMYQAGWQISKASVVSSIVLTVILFILGSTIFKEMITMDKAVGMIFCIIGIMFMNR